MSKFNEARTCSHRAIAMKRTALRWMRLVLHLVAAAAGSNENAGIGLLAQQIEIVGLWPWLWLVTSMATSAPLVAPFERLGVATLKVPWRPGARDNRQPREAAMEVLR